MVLIGRDTQEVVGGKTYTERMMEKVQPEYRERIRFLGRLDRQTGVLEYLRKAHVCCYPSHMESFGMAPIEAMAVGKPTIFMKTGPGPEVIEDGVSGLLCDPESPADIADKIKRILDDDLFAGQLGRNARERVLKHFETSGWIRRNIDFYRQCIDGFRGKA